MAETRAADSISAIIRDVTGSMIAVGKNIFQIQITFNIHGIPLFRKPPSERPQPRLRPVPIKPPPPRRFLDLLDRGSETGAASAALQAATPVQVYGSSGIGKTVLLQHLAYHGVTTRFPDGVTYYSPLSGGYSSSDLLHAIFTMLFEFAETADGPVRLTDVVLRQWLHDRQALVILDHVELSREDAEGLLQAAPSCTFLIASTSRSLWGDARAIGLRGLPLEEAMLLLERRGLERSIRDEERAAAKALCTALDGHPLSILQAGTLVRERGRLLDQVVASLQSQPAQGLASEIRASLTDEERTVLAVLAALRGAAVGVERLSAITQLPDVERVLDGLNLRFLVRAHSPRYSATALAEQVISEDEIGQWASSTLGHFVRWAEEHRAAPDAVVQETDAILALMRWAAVAERSTEVARLARAIDGALALGLRWGAWAQVLEHALRAARHLGDRAVEAWALHQQGSRALCVDDLEEAKRALTEALKIREALGDKVGAAVTRHNLDLLLGPPPGERRPDEPGQPPRPSPTPSGMRLVKTVLVAIAVVALSTGGVVAWNRLAKPIFKPSPDHVDFERLDVGTSRAESIEIRSEGRGDLQISAIELTGPHADDFRLAPGGCRPGTIPPGSACQVNIVFNPRGAGARSAALRISDNARGSPHKITLGGIGIVVPPGVLVTRSTHADFGQQEVRRATAPRQIVLENGGPRAVSIKRIEVAGLHAAEFRIDEGICANARLAAHQACALAVVFTPGAEGSRAAQVIIIHDGSNSPTTVELTGRGIVPPGVLDIIPGTLDFRKVFVGRSSSPRRIALRNRGQGPLGITSIVRGGTHADEFQILENHCQAALSPNDRCLITIRFQPTEVGRHTASLEIAAGGQSKIVKLTGAAVLAPTPTLTGRLEVSPDPLDFGKLRVGEATKPRQVTVQNMGPGPLGIRGVSLKTAPGEFSIVGNTCEKRTLEPGGQCVVTVIFQPTEGGVRSSVLGVASDAVEKTVELIGFAVSAPTPTLTGRLEVSPDRLDFRTVRVGEAGKPDEVYVRNTGQGPLSIRGVEVTPGDFAADDQCGTRTLEPGGGCVVKIRFNPRAEGPVNGTLVVYSAADKKTVVLVGQGASQVTLRPPEWLKPGSVGADAPTDLHFCTNLTLEWAPVHGLRPITFAVTLERRDVETNLWTLQNRWAGLGVRETTQQAVPPLRQRTVYRWRVQSFVDAGTFSVPSPWYYFACTFK